MTEPRRDKRGKLYPVKGCGRCADIFAAYLLTGDPRIFAKAEQHLGDHERQPSIWPDVNEIAELANS